MFRRLIVVNTLYYRWLGIFYLLL